MIGLQVFVTVLLLFGLVLFVFRWSEDSWKDALRNTAITMAGVGFIFALVLFLGWLWHLPA